MRSAFFKAVPVDPKKLIVFVSGITATNSGEEMLSCAIVSPPEKLVNLIPAGKPAVTRFNAGYKFG